jgi:hypothetical protein
MKHGGRRRRSPSHGGGEAGSGKNLALFLRELGRTNAAPKGGPQGTKRGGRGYVRHPKHKGQNDGN